LYAAQEYLEARAQAIEDVETHIVELGQIFNRLASMIAEQRELVER
jgi:syntaxin 5